MNQKKAIEKYIDLKSLNYLIMIWYLDPSQPVISQYCMKEKRVHIYSSFKLADCYEGKSKLINEVEQYICIMVISLCTFKKHTLFISA